MNSRSCVLLAHNVPTEGQEAGNHWWLASWAQEMAAPKTQVNDFGHTINMYGAQFPIICIHMYIVYVYIYLFWSHISIYTQHFLYMFILICMHAYIHTSIHTSIHPCIHPSIHPSIHTCIHTYIHPCMHTFIATYLSTYIYKTSWYSSLRYISHCDGRIAGWKACMAQSSVFASGVYPWSEIFARVQVNLWVSVYPIDFQTNLYTLYLRHLSSMAKAPSRGPTWRKHL